MKSYLLILIWIQKKINEVMVEIKKSGFDSAVSKYSISSTASNKGKLGWINSSSLSQDFLIILKI